MRLLLIFLFAVSIGICSSALNSIQANQTTSCSTSRFWNCSWKEEDTVPTGFDASRLIGNSPISTAIKLNELNVYYLIKVNSTTGNPYVSAILRWRFKEKFGGPKTLDGFYVFVKPENSKNTIFYNVDLKRKGNSGYEFIEISILLDQKLHFDEKYNIFVTTHPTNLNATIHKTLTIPSIPQKPSTCTPKEILTTRKISSRWSTGYPFIRLFPLHGYINVTFFGAPPNLCIDRYRVQLWMYDAFLVEEIYVPKDKLWFDEKRNSIGSVVFAKPELGKNYSIKITPMEFRELDGVCVCQYEEICGCVSVKSQPFVFSLNESHFQHPHTSEDDIKLEITSKNKSNNDALLYVSLATFLGVVTVVFIALVLWQFSKRTCPPKNKFRKNYVLVNQQNHDGKEGGPVIKTSKYISILILDVDPFDYALTELLAQNLKSNGMRVRYAKWEQAKIEENKFQWVHQVQNDVDKILLFHCQKAKNIVENKGATGLAILDDVFYILISMIGFNDPRIVNTCWKTSKTLLLPYTETLYVLPRDISFLFKTLDIMPDEMFFAQLKKMTYQQQQEVSPKRSIASANEDRTSEATTTQEVSSFVESTEDEEHRPLVNEIKDGEEVTNTTIERDEMVRLDKSKNENTQDSGFHDDSRRLDSIAW